MNVKNNKIIIFFLYLLLTVIFRYPALIYPYLDIDEVMWGIAAEAIVDGHPPYVYVLGEKGPLLYLFFAGIFKVFGIHNYFAVHIITLFWVSISSLILYKCANFFVDSKASLFCGFLYIVFSNAPGFRMISTSGEILMNLPLLLSLFYLLKFTQKNSFVTLFISTALVIIAASFRQQSLTQLGLIGTVIIFYPNKNYFLKFKYSLIYILGIIIPLTLIYLYLKQIDAWAAFKFWTIDHNASYIESGFANKNVLWNFFKNFFHILAFTFPLWFYSFKNILYIRKSPNFLNILLFIYLIFSFIAVIPGGRFFPHYFLQTYPALCLLTICYLNKHSNRNHYIFLGIFILLNLFKLPFTGLEMRSSKTQDYSQSHQIVGEYLKLNSKPGDRIFIWGWSQGLYYYSKLKPGSRFISSDFLTGRSPSQNDQAVGDTSKNQTPGAWKMFMYDLKERKPIYIIDTSVGNHHSYAKYPMKDYPLLMEYVKKYYQFEINLEGMDLYRRINAQ
jgi:hypothetical protein